MIIYVLILDNGCHQELLDVEDIICCASSKIEDILAYLDENVKVDYVSNYTLVCFEEGTSLKCTYGMGVTTYGMLDLYPYYIFNKEENVNEYEHLKSQLKIWCDKLKAERMRLFNEREQKKKEENEQKERELYEKLKAKYESE